MPEKRSARVERLENLVGVLAGKQAKLDDLIVHLTKAQIRTEQRFQAVARRFAETDKRFAETDKRFRRLDDRINSLVGAIGETRRRQNGKK